MTAVANLNLSSDLNITPSRKRKRQEKVLQDATAAHKTTAAAAVPPTSYQFTNEAFSSTPKKILAKRRLNKENTKVSVPIRLGELEIKSIADLAKDTNDDSKQQQQQIPLNPYEVLRKPPKKKKRPAEAACFENPGLNLNIPEKQFNPYEIVREHTPVSSSNCFVNPALNLKTQDVPASRNPFEIPRNCAPPQGTMSVMPCKLKIGLPFVPNVGCRIDFKDMSMSQLTPSKLLSEKLVFSPVPKASLGSIGEETMDIGKELDCYQLELENSINEAKLRKNGAGNEHFVISPLAQTLEIDVEHSSNITHKLTEIREDNETEIIEETVETTEEHTEIRVTYNLKEHVEVAIEPNTNPFEKTEILPSEMEPIEGITSNPFAAEDDEGDIIANPEDLDELYGPDSDVEAADNSFDFKAPAAFVRAYTRAASPKLRVSKESLETQESGDKPPVPDESTKKTMNVRNMIRKSIRKLMHPNGQHQKSQQTEQSSSVEEKSEQDKHLHGGIMNTIRQSLRRKPARTLLEEEPSEIQECELSIIDGSERTMKLKSNLAQTEYVKIEDLTNEKKHNIRNSIRRSTREVGHHFMKSVFHKKHEEYEFSK